MITVATSNLGARGRIPDADVIGLQEAAGTKARTIAAWLDEHPYGRVYDGSGTQGRGKTPILYDTAAVSLLASSVPRILARTKSPVGAGGPYIDNKYATTCRFRELATGAEFTVVNVHGPPSLWNPKRRRLHKTWAANLTEHVARIDGPCVVVGDFNCRWKHKHLNGLRALGFRLDNPPGPTLKGRQIDLVMSRA